MRFLKACTPLMLLCLMILPFCGGCTSQDEDTAIQTTTEASVSIALDAWALKGSKQEATLAAAQIVTNGKAVLAVLESNPSMIGQDVWNTLNTDLLKNVDPLMANAIKLASSILDHYIPKIPTGALSDTEMGYIKAFLNGCIDGSENSIVGPPATAGTARKHIASKTKKKVPIWFKE